MEYRRWIPLTILYHKRLSQPVLTLCIFQVLPKWFYSLPDENNQVSSVESSFAEKNVLTNKQTKKTTKFLFHIQSQWVPVSSTHLWLKIPGKRSAAAAPWAGTWPRPHTATIHTSVLKSMCVTCTLHIRHCTI